MCLSIPDPRKSPSASPSKLYVLDFITVIKCLVEAKFWKEGGVWLTAFETRQPHPPGRLTFDESPLGYSTAELIGSYKEHVREQEITSQNWKPWRCWGCHKLLQGLWINPRISHCVSPFTITPPDSPTKVRVSSHETFPDKHTHDIQNIAWWLYDCP